MAVLTLDKTIRDSRGHVVVCGKCLQPIKRTTEHTDTDRGWWTQDYIECPTGCTCNPDDPALEQE